MTAPDPRFSALFNSPMIGLLFWDATGSITEANDTFLATVGYTREDLRAGLINWRGMTPPEYKEADDRAVAEQVERGVCTPFEKEYVRKDGSRVPVLVGGSTITRDPTAGVAYVLDLSAERRAQREILDRVADGFVVLDAAWRYTYVNEHAARILGRRPQDLMGKHFWTEFPEVKGHKFGLAMERAMKEQTPITIEEYFAPWNKWYESHMYPSKDGIAVFFNDVTGRRRAEMERQEGEERFRFIAEHASQIIVIADRQGRVQYINPAYERLTGRPRDEFQRDPLAWVNQIHPDDRDRMIAFAQTDRDAKAEFRLVGGDGAIRWFRAHASPVHDAHGRPARLSLIFDDITEFKRREDELQEHVVRLEEQTRSRTSLERLVGKSAPMQEVYRRVRLAAKSDATVLITGESGTGKELVARAIHAIGPRKDKPFVAVNCSAIPETLLESELFGHVKGAFTGALRDRIGIFEAADGGTLFLDEVSDMAPALQLKLLRALQEREMRRVGDDVVFKVDVRLLTATNRDLAADLKSGALREDFYYRVNVFSIVVPPLRDRREDIPLLVESMIADLRGVSKKDVRRIDPTALRRLMNHAWSGNVRELRNAIEHAFVTVEGQAITIDDLPPEIQIRPPPEKKADDERSRITLALQECGGNKAKAAKKLGISRVTLWKRIRELGLVNGR